MLSELSLDKDTFKCCNKDWGCMSSSLAWKLLEITNKHWLRYNFTDNMFTVDQQREAFDDRILAQWNDSGSWHGCKGIKKEKQSVSAYSVPFSKWMLFHKAILQWQYHLLNCWGNYSGCFLIILSQPDGNIVPDTNDCLWLYWHITQLVAQSPLIGCRVV